MGSRHDSANPHRDHEPACCRRPAGRVAHRACRRDAGSTFRFMESRHVLKNAHWDHESRQVTIRPPGRPSTSRRALPAIGTREGEVRASQDDALDGSFDVPSGSTWETLGLFHRARSVGIGAARTPRSPRFQVALKRPNPNGAPSGSPGLLGMSYPEWSVRTAFSIRHPECQHGFAEKRMARRCASGHPKCRNEALLSFRVQSPRSWPRICQGSSKSPGRSCIPVRPRGRSARPASH